MTFTPQHLALMGLFSFVLFTFYVGVDIKGKYLQFRKWLRNELREYKLKVIKFEK